MSHSSSVMISDGTFQDLVENMAIKKKTLVDLINNNIRANFTAHYPKQARTQKLKGGSHTHMGVAAFGLDGDP